MKKKKLFLGLALSLGLFALASCNTTNNPSQSSSTTPAEATTGQSGTEGAQTQGEATSGEQTSGGAESSQAAQKFTITYNANGHGTAPAALADVNAYPETLPTLTEEGYQFMGWATTATAIEANVTAGAAITTDVTVYAVWVERPTYASISAKDGAILASKFDEAESVIKNTYQGYNPGMTGFYNSSFAGSSSDTTDGCTVTVTDGKAVGTDSSNKATTALTAEIGFVYEGVVEGVMKYTPTNTDGESTKNTGWSMVQFMGYKEFGDDATSLFALRTYKKTGDTDPNKDNASKIQLYYKCKENSTATSATEFYKGTAIAYTPGTEMDIYWKYDFATSAVTVKIDNKVVVENEVLPEDARPVFLSGVQFITAKDDTKRGFKVDDFAVAQTSSMTLDEVKTYLTSILDATVAQIDLTAYSFIASDIATGVQTTKAAVSAATTKDEAFGAVMGGMMALFDENSFLTDAEYKEKEIQTIESAKTQMSQYYTANADDFNAAFDTCVAAITAATTRAAIETARETLTATINAIDSDAKIRANAVQTYTTSYGTAVTDLAALPLDSTKLAAATTELQNVSTKYVGTEDALGLFFTCQMAELATTLTAAQGELTGVITKYSSSLDDYKATLETEFETYKATALEASGFDETIDATLYAGVSSMTINFEGVTDNDGADAALAAAKANVDEKIALYAYKYNSTDGIEKQFNDYVTAQVATLKIAAADYETSYKSGMDDITNHFNDDLFNATATADADTYLTNYKAAVDDLIDTIKLATETTVTFKNGDTTVDTADVLVGGKVTRPAEDPTQDGYVFKGWFADAACTTQFDFTNTEINTATTIYAGWYDTYNVIVPNTITDTLTTVGERPGYVDANTHPNTAISNSIITYKFNADLSKDVIMSNGTIAGLGFNDASKSDGSRYIEIVLTSKGKISFSVGNATDNVGYVSIGTTKATASSTDTDVVTVPKKKDKADLTTYTSDVLEAGTYYINWSRKQLLFNTISVEILADTRTITAITADAQANAGSIAVSNVKLFDNATTPNEIAITTGYNVVVKNSSGDVVENANLTMGETYTVVVSYGYTKYETTVTMPAVS